MRRSTAVTLLILIILAGLYWYLQQPGNIIEAAIQPTSTTFEDELERLIPLEKGSITRLTIEHISGISATLDHSTGNWVLTTDKDSLPTQPETAGLVVTGLFNLKVLSKIDPAPDPTSLALEPPRYRLGLLLADGSQLNFNIGDQTVTQSGYYIQTADGNVYVVATYDIKALIDLMLTQPYLQTPTPDPLSEDGLPALDIIPAIMPTP